MATKTIEAPALYADHHVTEIRRILLEIPGVSDVYASSAFHVIEITYDAKKVKFEKLTERLKEAGYLDELPTLTETGTAVEKKEGDGLFRHTAVYETTRETVSFAQRVSYQGRPLWPCPGMGPVEPGEN